MDMKNKMSLVALLVCLCSSIAGAGVNGTVAQRPRPTPIRRIKFFKEPLLQTSPVAADSRESAQPVPIRVTRRGLLQQELLEAHAAASDQLWAVLPHRRHLSPTQLVQITTLMRTMASAIEQIAPNGCTKKTD
jgi:hypothetical protein